MYRPFISSSDDVNNTSSIFCLMLTVLFHYKRRNILDPFSLIINQKSLPDRYEGGRGESGGIYICLVPPWHRRQQ